MRGSGVRWSEVIGEGSASDLIDSSGMERSCKRVEAWCHEESLLEAIGGAYLPQKTQLVRDASTIV